MGRSGRMLRLAAFALVATGLLAGATPVARAGAPYSVTLAASATTLPIGGELTLTATANQEIASPYGLVVVDGSGSKVVTCFGLVSTCESFPVAWDEDKTETYTAKIVNTGDTDVLATSSSVTVTWGAGSSTGGTVTRTAGADRFATSVALASGFTPGVPVVYLATGLSFADALAGGAAAAAEGGPVLTTMRDALPSAVASELARLRPAEVIILGGTAAISESVATTAGLLTGAPVTRVAGVDRYATAAAISSRVFDPGVAAVYVATGETFADALSGGVAAAARGVPVLLVQGQALPAVTAAELDRLDPATIVVLSSAGAVSAAVQQQLADHTSGAVVPFAGADRYATSAALSAAAFASGPATLYLATGEGFADALAGVALAGRTASPMLLVRTACVPSSVLTEITRLDATTIVVIGGTAAVSPAAASLTVC